MMKLNRRSFITTACFAGLYPLTGFNCFAKNVKIDNIIAEALLETPIPGCAAGIVKNGNLAWAEGYGWADLDKKRPMTPRTVMNIASVSKTITATAVMQLWQSELIDLDEDVSAYFSFPIRNPRFPSKHITVRQLLSHRSSIKDGKFYRNSYSCGDPAISLTKWIEGYFKPDGAYYDAEDNFHIWPPGTSEPPDRSKGYSNVAYGLLGNLVERITGMDFAKYCRKEIFTPLGMKSTGWHLSEINRAQHATLYSSISDKMLSAAHDSFEAVLPAPGYSIDQMVSGESIPHCLYSFPNYPDGLVRTNVEDLALFLSAYANSSRSGKDSILHHSTIELMLDDTYDGRALCWARRTLENGDVMWEHGGNDPGVSTYMGFREKDGAGVIVFLNFDNTRESRNRIIASILASLDDC